MGTSIALAFAMNSCRKQKKEEKRSSETTNTITTDKSVEKNDSNVNRGKTTVDDKNKIKTVETIQAN
jgi:hypothetical protein